MAPFDIAIIGGGMVGLSLALALKPSLDAGRTVVVIDPAETPKQLKPHSPSFDDRATALAAYSCKALDRLGVWSELAGHASEIDWIEVSDRGHPGYQCLDSRSLFGEPFGAVVSNANLGQALWQQAQVLANVDWRFGQSVTGISPGPDYQLLHDGDSPPIKARLVFLCDGGRSPLLNRVGIRVKHQPYGAIARIATLATEEPHRGRAYERFTEYGPLALLPFGNYSALVWTYPERLDKRIERMSTDEQLQWLNDHFGQRLGRIQVISPTLTYPLTLSQAEAPARHRLLALGNSAATLHPVAGQGFNLAMRSLMRSARYCNKQLLNDLDPGDFNGLQQLVSNIEKDQRLTATFSDQLVRTFRSTNPLVQWTRNLALNSLDRHPLAQKAFALASMGLIQGAPLTTGIDR